MVDCIQKVEETMEFGPGDMLFFKRTGSVAIIVRKGKSMPGQPNNDWLLWTNVPYKNMYTPMAEERLRMDDVEVFSASR